MDQRQSDLSNRFTVSAAVLLLSVTLPNEPWSIDHAALHPGRFDEKIYVPPPDHEARRKIFALNLKGRPLEGEFDLKRLAEMTAGYSGADIRQICLKAVLIPFHESVRIGTDRGISMRDMLQVLTVIKPSISAAMIKKYEDFRIS